MVKDTWSLICSYLPNVNIISSFSVHCCLYSHKTLATLQWAGCGCGDDNIGVWWQQMAILIMISIQWAKQIACNQYGKYHIKIGCLCEKCLNLHSLINTIASFIEFYLLWSLPKCVFTRRFHNRVFKASISCICWYGECMMFVGGWYYTDSRCSGLAFPIYQCNVLRRWEELRLSYYCIIKVALQC